MTKALRVLVVTAALAAPSLAQANLLTNPGFEDSAPSTLPITGWSTSGDVMVISCAAAATGCAPSGGTNLATLNNIAFNQNASLIQAVTVTGPGAYEFGAMVALGTRDPVGNFSQAQISLTVQGPNVSATVGQNPSALAGQFINTGGAGFRFTDWFVLSGTLVYTGVGPISLLVNINVQVFDPTKTLAVNVDNAFLRAVAVPVPEPASLALLAAGLLGLGFARARREG